MIAENETFKTPEENYETAALELAIYRMMQRDHDNAKAAFSPKDAKKLSQTAQKSLPHMLKLIDRQTRKLALHKTLRKQGFRILKTAAVIVLVLNMGLTIATAASSNIRAKVIEFLAEINDSYMVISFMTTDEELSVPETWTENYYPTYIPEEYSLQFINSQNGISEVEYADAQASKQTQNSNMRYHCYKQNQHRKRRYFAHNHPGNESNGFTTALRRNGCYLGNGRSLFCRYWL